VVELVRAGVVEILALQVDLALAELAGEPFAVVHRRRPALKLLADAPEFADELRAVADGFVSVVNLLKHGYELRRQIRSAVIAKAAVVVGILLDIVREIFVRHHGRLPFPAVGRGLVLSFFSFFVC
jgi:hypothetical protein